MTDEQFTERTHHGDFFSYRISEKGETFAEFMARSPYYHSMATDKQAEILHRLRMPFFRGQTEFGWSDFTYTKYAARKLVSVSWVEQLNNSQYGNPRYRLHCTGTGYFDTEPDGSVGYSITNFTNGRIRETYILDERQVTLVLNKRGHITDIERNGVSLKLKG